MNNKYIFGGFVKCGGKLDSGKPWTGFRVLLARVGADGKAGTTAIIGKASCTDSMADVLLHTSPGAVVEVYFDDRGRIATLSPIK